MPVTLDGKDSIDRLHDTITVFGKQTDRHAKSMFTLTLLIAILTVVMLAAVIVQIVILVC